MDYYLFLFSTLFCSTHIHTYIHIQYVGIKSAGTNSMKRSSLWIGNQPECIDHYFTYSHRNNFYPPAFFPHRRRLRRLRGLWTEEGSLNKCRKRVCTGIQALYRPYIRVYTYIYKSIYKVPVTHQIRNQVPPHLTTHDIWGKGKHHLHQITTSLSQERPIKSPTSLSLISPKEKTPTVVCYSKVIRLLCLNFEPSV